jgi:hypothetical protein
MGGEAQDLSGDPEPRFELGELLTANSLIKRHQGILEICRAMSPTFKSAFIKD